MTSPILDVLVLATYNRVVGSEPKPMRATTHEPSLSLFKSCIRCYIHIYQLAMSSKFQPFLVASSVGNIGSIA